MFSSTASGRGAPWPVGTSPPTSLSLLVAAIIAAGCSESHSSAAPAEDAPLIVTTGVQRLEPAPAALSVAGLDLARLEVASIEDFYEFTTPSGEGFGFHVLSRAAGNSGSVRISLGHARAGTAAPTSGPETLIEAGIQPSGTGLGRHGNWLDASGDGFARLTVTGSIIEPQDLLVRVDAGRGARTALIRLRIGPRSEIHHEGSTPTLYPGVIEESVVYSSDSWRFTLPTIAVSGDRISMVTYEGDQADPWRLERYERRLQYDLATGAVTGGGTEEANADSGNWRDHEVAALFNVLALVRCGAGEVSVQLSFDRGARFAQVEVLPGVTSPYSQRLIQVAMAADYTLGIAYWQADAGAASALYLVEGVPSHFDGNGSPLEYEFSEPERVHDAGRDVSPLTLGMQYSEGGDLVLGYGYSWFERLATGAWSIRTQCYCSVRLFGEEFRETFVDEDEVVGYDPSVALLGAGEELRIFYAYEMRDGIRLRTSDDAGRSFSAAHVVGANGAHLPSVFARESGGDAHVDLLYLEYAADGVELRLAHWEAFPEGASSHRLTVALAIPSNELPPGSGTPGAGASVPVSPYGIRVTHVGWFGYDAVLAGDDLIVAVDEQTYDTYYVAALSPFAIDPTFAMGAADAAEFQPAEPPPLAPGMTEPVAPPDPGHLHQLKVLRLD